MQTGWLNLGGTWYYLQPSGAMATGWTQVSGTWYYLASSGVMATGWTQVGGTWYYLAPSGTMQTGWLNLGGTWYYLQPSGAMATGQRLVDGRLSTFSAVGVWQGYVGGSSGSGGGYTSSSFQNCTAAWNAGAAPLYRIIPGSGYAPRLDKDGDGIACEVDPR